MGGVSETLNNKGDRDGANIPSDSLLALKSYVDSQISSELSNIRYVIETDGDTTNWYRLWSDNWLEQGGWQSDSDVASSITFKKSYNSKEYVLVTQMIKPDTSSESGNDVTPRIYNQTSTGFGYQLKVTTGKTGQGVRNWSWYTCGYKGN